MASFNQIMTDLKNKKYKPLYLLMGEEAYYIDKISEYIAKNVLTEQEKDFNLTILYGKDADVTTVDHASRRFPMMSKYQVIIVKEAQNLQKIENLVHYATKPSKSTILVINYKYKSLNRNKKVYKAFDKNGVVFSSKKIYDNQVPDWIISYLKDKKYTITPAGCALMSEFVGNDLGKLANELDKLMMALPEKTEINPQHIEENIGYSKDFNNFELQDAIRRKDVVKANRIINYFARNPRDHPIVLTITSLYFFFSKVLLFHSLKDKSRNNVAGKLQIRPYFVKDYEYTAKRYPIKKVVSIISILRQYDMKSKGLGNVSTGSEGLLKELIFKIIH